MRKKIIAFFTFFYAFTALAQMPADAIRLNQIGFYPGAPKKAVVVGQTAKGNFYLKEATTRNIVFTGVLSADIANPLSGKKNVIADFSAFQKSGRYYLEIPAIGVSYTFDIKKDMHQAVTLGALKGFYYQRTAVELPSRYAGEWARPAGHPDTQVYVHSSASTEKR
jgi:endoglucanase